MTRQKKYIVGGILKLKNAMVNMRLLWTIQANLDLRNFFFLNRTIFDIRKIYVLNLKTGGNKNVLCIYLVEFANQIFS